MDERPGIRDEPLCELRRRTFLQVLGSGLLVTVAVWEGI